MNNAIIAIDIGTTNIEAVLADSSGNDIEYKSVRNEQRRFGSDVAARICAATDGHADEMRVSVLSQICEIITAFVTGHPDINVTNVAIAGNTTMLHLLMGYDCSGLGLFPFTPVSLDPVSTTTHELIADFLDGENSGLPELPVTILPGISAYLGADIYAGAVALGLGRMSPSDDQVLSAPNEQTNLLVDLGTNAELILGNSRRLLAASAAAGPAFESNRIFKGTEGIEMLHRLLTLGVIDKTGLMGEEYFEKLAQKNIRKLQLAKAAIRAAISVLLEKYGIGARDVANIFVSGNFGNHLDETACIAVGMFPQEFAGRIKAVGNTVLKGCIEYILQPADRIPLSLFEEVVLANEESFNDLLMNSIYL